MNETIFIEEIITKENSTYQAVYNVLALKIRHEIGNWHQEKRKKQEKAKCGYGIRLKILFVCRLFQPQLFLWNLSEHAQQRIGR